MRGITELFRGREAKDKKQLAANQAWEITREMVKESDPIEFRVEKKIERDKLPEELKEWIGYENIWDSFNVMVSSKFGPGQITITSGVNSVKLIIRGPEVESEITEIRDDGRFPFTVESQQDPAAFARDFTAFVRAHWLRNQQLRPR